MFSLIKSVTLTEWHAKQKTGLTVIVGFMSIFEGEFNSPGPRQIAVLFIDLQHRWTYGRSRTLLPEIVSFARSLRQTDIRQMWIGDRIGEPFNVPQAVSSLDPVTSFQHILHDNRFIYDLSDMRGGVIDKQMDDAFSNPLLASKLKMAGITTVLGCGFIAGQCVMSTLEGARRHGFNIAYLADKSIDNRPCGGLGKWAADHQRFSSITPVESGELFDYLERRKQGVKPRLLLSMNDIISVELHGISGFRDWYNLRMPGRPVAAVADVLSAKTEHFRRFLSSLTEPRLSKPSALKPFPVFAL